MKVFRSVRLLMMAFLLALVPASSFAGVLISINIAPPVMPVYEQPICPEDGYIWTPGYWAYGDDGYYWVPGAWVPAPQPGYLWTPPYWGWEGGHYLFHGGYWGEHVGYYGGVNYGFGYMGIGFAGGDWRGGHFFYNTAVMHVGGGFRNTYVNETIIHNTTIINDRHVAYSGGPGGIRHEASPQERVAMNEHHVAPTAMQQQHFQAAARDPQQHFANNHGRPATVAAARPLAAPVHTQSAIRPGGQGQPANQAHTNVQASQPQNHNTQMARPNQQQSHPAMQQESRPAAPQSRPALQQQNHPAPQSHPAPQQQYHPAPQPQSHPAPQQQSHPAPQSRPAPQPQYHAAPQQSRPAPQSHPAPASRPNNEKPHGR